MGSRLFPIRERLDFIGLLIIALTLPLSEALKNIGVVLAIVGFFLNNMKGRSWTGLSLFGSGVLIFIFAAFLSSLFSADVMKGLKGLNDIVRFSIVFFAASTMEDEEDVYLLIKCFIFSALAAAAIGLYLSVTTGGILETGTLGNANYTAMYLGMAASSTISIILFSKNETSMGRGILLFSLIILLIAVIHTTMRATLLGLMAFVFTILILSRNVRVWVVSGLTAIMLTLAVISYAPMREKFFQFHSLTQGRRVIWQKAVEVFIGNPFLGVGPNQFYSSSSVETVFDAHSLYLQTLSQMGIIGGIGLALIIIGFIIHWTRFYAEGSERVVKYSALGAFLIITIPGIFDTTLHHEHGVAFMLLTGLMVSFKDKRDGYPIKL